MAGYWIKVKDNGRNFMYLFIMAMYSVFIVAIHFLESLEGRY